MSVVETWHSKCTSSRSEPQDRWGASWAATRLAARTFPASSRYWMHGYRCGYPLHRIRPAFGSAPLCVFKYAILEASIGRTSLRSDLYRNLDMFVSPFWEPTSALIGLPRTFDMIRPKRPLGKIQTWPSCVYVHSSQYGITTRCFTGSGKKANEEIRFGLMPCGWSAWLNCQH